MLVLRKFIRKCLAETSYDPYDPDSWIDDDNEPVDEPIDPANVLDSAGRYFTSEKKYETFRNETDQSEGPKPAGLWYSCGPEWVEFLRGELRVSYPERYEGEQFIYEIQPIHEQMIVIRNSRQFEEFTNKFGYEDSDEMIRWDLVSERFAGIEICPHLSKMKMHPWYRNWDVASGCIWSRSAVDWIRLMMQRDSEGFWEEVSGRLQT